MFENGGPRPLRLPLSQFKMALSSGRLVTSIISPSAWRGDPDCSKTKLTVRVHPREPFFPKSLSRMRTEMGKNAEKYSWGCSQTVSFVFGQSGSPLHARGIIILVTDSALNIHVSSGGSSEVDRLPSSQPPRSPRECFRACFFYNSNNGFLYIISLHLYL